MKTSSCHQQLHGTRVSLWNTSDGLKWDRTKTQRASQSDTSPDSQLGRIQCHTGRVRCSNGCKLRNSLQQQFSQTLYTGLKHKESYKLSSHWMLTLDTSSVTSNASDLIPNASSLILDASGLYQTCCTEMIFNFFPCFHVPTSKCHNTCASVLAFSQIFFQGS